MKVDSGRGPNDPRYQSGRSTLPQPSDGGGEDPASDYYVYGGTGANTFSQGGAGQHGQTAFPGPYGSQDVYASSPPLAYSQNSGVPYADTASLYGSQTRFGFPATLNTQSGVGGQYGASNLQSVPFEDQYGIQRQAALSQFDLQPSSRPIMQSMHPSRNPPAAEYTAGPASSYQQGSYWATEGSLSSGTHRGQPYNSALSEQSNPAGLSGTYSTSTDKTVKSPPQVDSALASQDSYSETLSASTQDDMSEIITENKTRRRRSIYSGSYMGKVDSSMAQRKSETAGSYGDNFTTDVKIEFAHNSSSQGTYFQY